MASEPSEPSLMPLESSEPLSMPLESSEPLWIPLEPSEPLPMSSNPSAPCRLHPGQVGLVNVIRAEGAFVDGIGAKLGSPMASKPSEPYS
jgi:hypothetical protein